MSNRKFALCIITTTILCMFAKVGSSQENTDPLKILQKKASSLPDSEKVVVVSAEDISAAEVNIVILKSEITQPIDHPIANNFTFFADATDPSGKCIIKVAGTSGVSTEEPKLLWVLSGITGSTLTSNPNPAMGANVTFTYAGLPNSNSQFGNKTLTLIHPLSNCRNSKTIQLFFDGSDDAKNHPGVGSGTTPNWFYYWLQTSAGFGSPLYAPNIAVPGVTAYLNSKWVALIGPLANDPTRRPHEPNKNTLLDGIDLFADVCRHEARHVQTNSIWYPNGYDPQIDRDDDGIPDAEEEILSRTPGNGGPFFPSVKDSDSDGYPDFEDYVYMTQQQWTKGVADVQDWSNPGHQSNK